MKILRLRAIAMAALLLPFPSIAASPGNVVASPTLGIRVTKPADWQILTAEANAENLSKVDFDNPEMAAAVARYASVPVIAFTKYTEPYEDLNPSFKINVRPMGALQGRTASEILEIALKSTLQMVKGTMDGTIQQTKVGGLPAAHARINYDLKAGGASFPTSSEMWIVPKGAYFFIIGSGTRQDEANGTRAEVAAIVESVNFGQ